MMAREARNATTFAVFMRRCLIASIVATAGFIPVEVYEIVQGRSAAKFVALALNVAIVAYLVVQVRKTDTKRGSASPPMHLLRNCIDIRFLAKIR